MSFHRIKFFFTQLSERLRVTFCLFTMNYFYNRFFSQPLQLLDLELYLILQMLARETETLSSRTLFHTHFVNLFTIDRHTVLNEFTRIDPPKYIQWEHCRISNISPRFIINLHSSLQGRHLQEHLRLNTLIDEKLQLRRERLYPETP